MLELSPADRRALRARAHRLRPVVMIGQQGLTPAVTHEIDVTLGTHELIKVKVLSAGREAREALLQRICDELECAAVQHLGRLLVLWRPKPAEPPAAAGKQPRRRRRQT